MSNPIGGTLTPWLTGPADKSGPIGDTSMTYPTSWGGITNTLGVPYYSGATNAQITPDRQPGGPAQIDQQAAARQAAYNQSLADLNFAEQRANNQYGVAQRNVNNGYTDAFKRLTDANELQQKQFGDTRLGQNKDYQSGRQDINQSVGNAYTGLQRLLGSRGAGNSSAASILAPYAAGQQGNIQSTRLQDTYGKNATLLDNSIASYNSGVENSKKELENQKQTNLRAAQQAYDNARVKILQSRQALNPGNASSYQQQINDLLGQVDQLDLKPTFTATTPTYTSPELAALQAGQIAPATIGGVSPGAVQQTGAFANLLAGQDKKKLVGQSPLATQ